MIYNNNTCEQFKELYDGARCVSFSDNALYCVIYYGGTYLYMYYARDGKYLDVKSINEDLTWQEIRIKSLNWLKEICDQI